MKINFEDLSPWLKTAIIVAWTELGIVTLTIFIGLIKILVE